MATETRRDTAVELVSSDGRTIGEAEKLSVHMPPGRLHRAFSVLLLDDVGHLIMQRRSLTKYHAAGLWSNTCCSHPAPGEPPIDAARRRLTEELGISEPAVLESAGTTTYRVIDPVSGLVEHEFNHLFVGLASQTPHPDPAEVDDVATMSLDEALALGTDDRGYAPWFGIVLRAAGSDLSALRSLAEPQSASSEGAARSSPSASRAPRQR